MRPTFHICIDNLLSRICGAHVKLTLTYVISSMLLKPLFLPSCIKEFILTTPVGASLVAQSVKNPPAMQETWVQSLDWEESLEEIMASHSSIPAWRIPWTEEPGGLRSLGPQRVRQDWATEHTCAAPPGYGWVPACSPETGTAPEQTVDRREDIEKVIRQEFITFSRLKNIYLENVVMMLYQKQNHYHLSKILGPMKLLKNK